MPTVINVYDTVASIGVNDPEASLTIYEMFIGVGPTGPTGATGPAGAAAVAGVLPSEYVEMSTPRTVTSATLVDITGVTADLVLDSTVNIAVFMDCEVSSNGVCDLGLAISINGTDHDVVTTHLNGSTDNGKVSVIHRTATPLAAGTYTVKGRFLRSSGTATPQVDRADFLVFGLQGAAGADGVDGVDGITPDAVHAATNKTTPVDADEVGIWNSVDGLLNRLSWANIKATLKAYFDALYLALVAPGTSGNVLTSNGTIWTSAAAVGGGGDWTDATGTWSYSSADAPTFVASVNADMTTTIYPGQRLSLTQTTEKFFIVTAVGAYSGGNTLITMYGGTDYTLANEAITTPKWSNVKVPSRFPMDPTKWTQVVSDTTARSQATPTQNTWYNLGALSSDIPIGIWKVRYSLLPYGYRLGTANAVQLQISLSTSNNSVSDATLSAAEYVGLLSSNAEFAVSLNKARPLPLVLAAKTTYYFIMRTISTDIGNISFENGTETLYLVCECAYL